MRTSAKQSLRRRHAARQRGAALILTVIVIMVLTTLGMAMVAFTTTEERTATTYRDSLQARALAEAGVRVVQEMFRSPGDPLLVPVYSATATADDTANPKTYHYWGTTETDKNTQLNEIGIWRKDRVGATPAKYSGNNNRFFYPPFRDTWSQTFGGQYSTTAADEVYDLKYNCTNPNTGVLITNASTECWLDAKINAMLLGSGDWNLRSGKITDISFYAPPAVANASYGITTVRVTAEKYDGANNTGTLLARETIVAIIGDRNPEPAILGNGNIVFAPNGDGCGDGCEQIHANGNAEVGDISGGQAPMVTATGSVTIDSGSSQSSAGSVIAPEINPWDDAYKPTNATDRARFYLAAARRLPVEWRDGDPLTVPAASRTCGFASTCQDYGLEYPAGSTTANAARTATDTPYLYRWNSAVGTGEWFECDADGNTTLSCDGLQFTVTRAADTPIGTTTDNASVPFNINRVPQTIFNLDEKLEGATVLVDGRFRKQTANPQQPTMTIIAAGSIVMTSNTEWIPASTTQRVMWISGRDIFVSADCCAPSNTCTTNLANDPAQGIIASHEQIEQNAANTNFAGILIAENRVNHDLTVDNSVTNLALNVPSNGGHSRRCDVPFWPWIRPTKPEIFSMTTATD